ncbi:L-2-amino-thiazoline-4-carboxylic acid hydrolase [Bradyrhizobium sp. SZCCHNPS1003]|uniref:L-2-amino-thiazoline-4-carboxylic acid hydrolase n=1 Tax=Bradyrhizobium sp. SZCCHNPS1003 TaxID=3057330 RepID=UPI0028E94856|nr:L-2-amino-thiazoline-4-carboxylic acid hydrolase [Bradyrhizobium sp. SZCCHNPS1003]
MSDIHLFYQTHIGGMQDAMRQRLDLAGPFLSQRAELSDIDAIRADVMKEFDVVLNQLPYVGGAASRMTAFFMQLIGFMAMSRVLRRHGLPSDVIGDIEREVHKAQLLTEPEAQRLEAGRRFMSPENRSFLRQQAALSTSESHRREFPDDFVYDVVEPGPSDTFEFGIDYKACGFCKFAARHGDKDILPNICGLDVDAYATRGVRLDRTQTLAGGASHCNFRFSRQASD